MNQFVRVVVAIVIGLGPTWSQAYGLFDTPNSARALVFEPLNWDGGYISAMYPAEDALAGQGYDTYVVSQNDYYGSGFHAASIIDDLAPSGTPAAYGALGMLTHGYSGTGEPAIEYFATQQDAYDAINYLVTFGYLQSSTEAIVGYNWNYYNSFVVWSVSLTNAALQRLSRPANAIIHLGACQGGFTYSSWVTGGSAATMVSYGATCPADQGVGDARYFWQNMHGYSGGFVRNLGNATYGTSLITNNGGNTGLVLAPWLTGIFPASSSVISGISAGYITFDTAMRTGTGLLNAVTVTDPPLGFWVTPGWSSNSRIDYYLYPKAKGTGVLTAIGSNIFSAGGIEVSTNGTSGVGGSAAYTCEPPTPASAMGGVTAETGPAGATVRFTTHWEDGVGSFQLERIDDPANPFWASWPVAPTGNGGAASYELFDPAGTAGSRYRVVEHAAAGLPDLRYGSVEAGPAPPLVPHETPSYNVDSLADVVAALRSGLTLQEESTASPGLYVLVAPDSLVDSLSSYVALWQYRGVQTTAVSVSGAEQAQGSIQQYLRWAYGQGTRYALLVGDANDAQWWDDPSRWVNGWNWPRVDGTGPHIPSQPERNLIPTFYTADTDSPRIAMSFYTPYYASDLPYADVDGDGLPDLRIGRIPIASGAEIRAYTAKLAAYLGTSPPEQGLRLGLLTYAQNNGLMRGDDVAADADTVAGSIPGGIDVTRFTDTETTLWTYAYRESLADWTANQAPDYMVWLATGAQRDIYANYWRYDQGWSMAKLAPVAPPNRFFVSLAFSCGMANFDETESYTSCDPVGDDSVTCSGPVTPIAERLLLDPQKGAIATVGPSRGTFERGNRLLALEVEREVFASGHDLGTAFMMAQRECLVRYPLYTDLFRSYILLGDPLIGGPTAISGVGVGNGIPRVGLGRAHPNPFNPSTSFSISLAVSSRVQLRVYDVRGRLVRTIIENQVLPAGTRTVRWDGMTDSGARAASGLYFLRMDAAGISYRQKIVLLK